jgi:hypothetical protein
VINWAEVRKDAQESLVPPYALHLDAKPMTWGAAYCAYAVLDNAIKCARGLDRWQDDGGP